MKYPLLSIILLLSLCCFAGVQAQTVKFVGVQGDELANIKNHLDVERFESKKTDISELEWLRFKSSAVKKIKQALEPFGYYQADVFLSEQSVGDDLVYQINLGKAVVIKEVKVIINGEAKQQAEFQQWLKQFPLNQGQNLKQIEYEQAKSSLLTMARRFGYFDAELAKHSIAINAQRDAATVKLEFDSGQRYRFGEIYFVWSKMDQASKRSVIETINPDILDTFMTVKSGQVFDAQQLAKTQRKLVASNYFSNAEIIVDHQHGGDYKVPLTVQLTKNKRHAYNAVLGVGTDTGPRVSLGYENRRINRFGHNLNARIGTSKIKSSAIINYHIPLQASTDNHINIFAALEEDKSDFRPFKLAKVGTEWSRRITERSILKYGVTASRESYVDYFDKDIELDLLLPKVRWEYTDVDDLQRPNKGWRGMAELRGANKSLASDVDIVQLLVNAKGLMPLGKGKLIGRFDAASSKLGVNDILPRSLGFLTGGDESVRGYRFESIGVNSIEDQPQLAKNLLVASIEYEHPIKYGLGIASFFDVGDAFNSDLRLKRGAGIGLRYRLPFGALRLDIASALDKPGKPLRVHFGFGTDL